MGKHRPPPGLRRTEILPTPDPLLLNPLPPIDT